MFGSVRAKVFAHRTTCRPTTIICLSRTGSQLTVYEVDPPLCLILCLLLPDPYPHPRSCDPGPSVLKLSVFETTENAVVDSQVTNGNTYTYALSVIKDPGVALPGFWYLFALNAAGVPSVSWTMQVTAA